MTRTLRLAAAVLALAAGRASAEIDYFNRPLNDADDALSREVLSSRSGGEGVHFFSGAESRQYSLDVQTGGSQTEGTTQFNGTFAAAVGFKDLPMTPSLDVTLIQKDAFSSDRAGASSVSAAARLFSTGFGLQGSVSGSGTFATRDSYAATGTLKYRLASPSVNALVRASYRRSALKQDGWALGAGAGWGVALPRLQVVALQVAASAGAAEFGGDRTYEGSATLEYHFRRFVLGARAATPLMVGKAVTTWGGFLGSSL